VGIEQGRDVEVVRDHEQALVISQRARDLLGRRADIEKQRGIVRDQLGRSLADGALFDACDLAARSIPQILDAGRHHGAAVNP
jgi:hypothetical protein